MHKVSSPFCSDWCMQNNGDRLLIPPASHVSGQCAGMDIPPLPAMPLQCLIEPHNGIMSNHRSLLNWNHAHLCMKCIWADHIAIKVSHHCWMTFEITVKPTKELSKTPPLPHFLPPSPPPLSIIILGHNDFSASKFGQCVYKTWPIRLSKCSIF